MEGEAGKGKEGEGEMGIRDMERQGEREMGRRRGGIVIPHRTPGPGSRVR